MYELKGAINCIAESNLCTVNKRGNGSYLFLEGLFLNDMRAPDAIDYSQPIVDLCKWVAWGREALSVEKRLPEFLNKLFWCTRELSVMFACWVSQYLDSFVSFVGHVASSLYISILFVSANVLSLHLRLDKAPRHQAKLMSEIWLQFYWSCL